MRQQLFTFRKSFGPDCTVTVEHMLTFPSTITPDSCFHHIVAKYDVPSFSHDALRRELHDFFRKEKRADFLERYTRDLDWLTRSDVNLNELCAQFDTAYQKHVSACLTPKYASDEVLFGQAYNRLVHSTRAEDLILLEHSLALAVSAEVDKRDRVLRQLEDDLISQTESELQKRDIDGPATVTQLQVSHIRMRELEVGRWDSIISELKRSQRILFRDKVMSMSAELAIPVTFNDTSSSKPAAHPTGHSVAPSIDNLKSSNCGSASGSAVWSESFTVQLGRQLRTTCNFRLIRADPVDLLTSLDSNLHHSQSADGELAQRLSNALGLYSNELNGLVILVDKRINSFRGMKKRLFDVCERSTEFHFPELGCQLAEIQATLDRMGPRHSAGVSCCTPSASSDLQCASRPPVREPVHGDVYITRHSNLAGGIGGLAGGGGGISVVFHLVYDEDAEPDVDRVRSTSPLHCALSAILRTCFDYDVTTLSLPLFLVPSLREYADISWRYRRAENILKLLKGALMEWSTWRGPVVHSIQLLAPSCLPDKEMESYSHLITSSFLQPVPVFVLS